jgi:hypothetical protein
MSGTISYATDFGGKLEAVHKMLSDITASGNTDFLNMFMNLEEMVTSNKFEWVDTTLVGFKDALSSALTTSTGTTITVSSGTNAPKRYIDGLTLIIIEDEVLLVNSTITVVTNASSYNVTRASLGTTASSHANLSEVMLYANPRVEGFSAGRDDSQKGSRKYNYTQILQREAKLTGTSQHVKSVGDEMKMNKQIKRLTVEIVKELQMSLINGIRYANDSTNYTDRKMGGFRYFATSGGGTNTSAAGNTIDKSMIEDVIETYLSNGGDANKLCLAVSTRQQRKLNEIKEARIIGGGQSQGEKNISNFVNRYDFGSSAQVKVILVPDFRKDEAYFFQEDLISVHPMEGRAWITKPLPEDGDFVREMILGEFTAVFRNVPETLFRYYNLAVA